MEEYQTVQALNILFTFYYSLCFGPSTRGGGDPLKYNHLHAS